MHTNIIVQIWGICLGIFYSILLVPWMIPASCVLLPTVLQLLCLQQWIIWLGDVNTCFCPCIVRCGWVGVADSGTVGVVEWGKCSIFANMELVTTPNAYNLFIWPSLTCQNPQFTRIMNSQHLEHMKSSDIHSWPTHLVPITNTSRWNKPEIHNHRQSLEFIVMGRYSGTGTILKYNLQLSLRSGICISHLTYVLVFVILTLTSTSISMRILADPADMVFLGSSLICMMCVCRMAGVSCSLMHI